MAHLKDVMIYLCKNFPDKNLLSNARLTKMIYLADWRSSFTHGKQITDIQWEFNHFGPFVGNVIAVAEFDPDFKIIPAVNAQGFPKQIISLNPTAPLPILREREKKTLDFVIQTTSQKNWSDFIRLVYSTYPIITQPRYSKLNLVELAESYKTTHALFKPESQTANGKA